MIATMARDGAVRRTRLSQLERSQVGEIQRARVLAAVGRAICEHGASDVTVGRIVERAGVSRRTFYDLFADCEECVLAAMQDALDRACARVLPVWSSDGDGRARLRRSLSELLGLFDEEPVIARLLVVESLSSGQRILEQRGRVLDALTDAIDQALANPSAGGQSTRLSAEAALGGVLAVLHARLVGRESGRLVEMGVALMSVLTLPYYGRAAARRELVRTVAIPPPTTGDEERVDLLRVDPFKDAGMRLTYRTVRVLSAIAEYPGSSNRRVGDLAGMSDQGQTSKLLSRLEDRGLIVNQSEGQGRGEANAWMLTVLGRQVTSSIRPRTGAKDLE